MHGYIVSEKYGVAFLLPDHPVQAKKEYVFTEEPKRLDNDAKFVNKVLVEIYEDAKQKFREERHTPNGAGPCCDSRS